MVSRRRILKTGVTGMTVGLTGCLQDGDSQDDNGDDEESGDASDTNVGIVYGIGGLDDTSYNNAANRGVREASDESGVEFENFEPETGDEIRGLQEELALSEEPDYNLVVCIGVEHAEPLRENADEYTDQNWALIDTSVDRPNVESWELAGEESAYLTGEAAARLSATEFSAGEGETAPEQKKLGFVGGAEIPVVQELEAGFRAVPKPWTKTLRF
jgi:basic membrane protein A